MRVPDLPQVTDLSMRIHVNYPERAEVLAEKLRLYPAGCFVLSIADFGTPAIIGRNFRTLSTIAYNQYTA